MAVYPLGEVKLMDNFELAERHSWDSSSMLKLVKIEMQMKYREFNDKIVGVINEHLAEVENYETFFKELYEKKKNVELNREEDYEHGGNDKDVGQDEEAALEEDGLFGKSDRHVGVEETVRETQDRHAELEKQLVRETRDKHVDVEEPVSQARDRHVELEEPVREARDRHVEMEEPVEEEIEEVLDQMLDKKVDYLDILMPNLSLNLPKLDPQGNTRKVQFSVKPSVSMIKYAEYQHD